MIGELVAIYLADVGPDILVIGYTAGLKNRQKVWSFEVPADERRDIPAMVVQREAARRPKAEE